MKRKRIRTIKAEKVSSTCPRDRYVLGQLHLLGAKMPEKFRKDSLGIVDIPKYC